MVARPRFVAIRSANEGESGDSILDSESTPIQPRLFWDRSIFRRDFRRAGIGRLPPTVCAPARPGRADEVVPLEHDRPLRRQHAPAAAVVTTRPPPAATFGPRGMAAVIGQQSGQGSSASAMQAGAQGHFQGFQVPPGFLSPAIKCYLEKRLNFACDFLMNSGSSFFSSSVQPASSDSTGRRRQIFSLSEVNSAASSWKRRNSFTS